MSNKNLFDAGLFCIKESVYNVLLEAAQTDTPELSNGQISKRLGIETAFKDPARFPLIRGILDELRRDRRVERVEGSGKMIWRVKVR